MCTINPSSFLKGVGHFCKAAGASLAIVAVAAIVTNIGVVLLVKDGYFFCSYLSTSPSALGLLVPVTLASITVNVMVIYGAIKKGVNLIDYLAKVVKESGDKMLLDCRATPINTAL